MSRFSHSFCIAVLFCLTSISFEIPKKKYGAPEWYATACWFANWKDPAIPVDCATNPPVSSYYTHKPVLGLRDADRGKFYEEIKKRGCMVVGVDYYALTNVTHLDFAPLFARLGRKIANGSVAYVKICRIDSTYKLDVVGFSDGADGR